MVTTLLGFAGLRHESIRLRNVGKDFPNVAIVGIEPVMTTACYTGSRCLGPESRGSSVRGKLGLLGSRRKGDDEIAVTFERKEFERESRSKTRNGL